MKVKILAQLKAKFPGASNALLDRVASVLEKTVTKEEDIETAVNGSAGLVQEFASFHQSEADRRVTEAVQKREAELKAEYEKGKKADPQKDPKEGDMPDWAKELVQTNKALVEKVTSFEQATTQKSLAERLVQQLNEKKIPAKYYTKAIEGRTFKDEQEMATFATSLETEYAEFNQELVNSGLMQQPTPVMGGQTKDGVPIEVRKFVDGIKAVQQGKSVEASSLGGKPL